MAGALLQLILTLFKIMLTCPLILLASIAICPSDKLPEKIYLPGFDIVIILLFYKFSGFPKMRSCQAFQALRVN